VEAVIAVIVLTFEFVEPNPSIREALIVTKISLLCLLVVILIGHLWWAIRQREYAINFPVPATSIIEALSTLGSSPHRILRNDLKRDEIQSFIDLHNEIFKSSKYPEDSVKYYEPSQISEAIIGWHKNEGSLGLVLSLARPIEGEAVSAEGEAVFSRRGSRFCADKSSCWGNSCVLPLTAKGADRYISENISAYVMRRKKVGELRLLAAHQGRA
jgi:hypothetical protein